MSRKGSPPKREVLPDPIYGSQLLTKFMNCLMREGKKSVAEKILYQTLKDLSEKGGKEPMEAFEKAVENAKPRLEVRSRRVGGATYQIPMEIRPVRRTTLAIRWIIQNARNRNERGMVAKLTAELLDTLNNNPQCGTIKKKQDTHRMAEANKAFAHYRW
jgi:small subunit ribosomal protein S7